MIPGPPRFRKKRPSINALTGREQGQGMRRDRSDYYRQRELAERHAAKNATCKEARQAHEKLADAYALRLKS